MAETINGSGAAVQNRESISFTPNVGGDYGGRYEGPKAAVKAKMDVLIAAGYACKYECDQSPVATLEFSTPSNSGSPTDPPTNPNADYTDNFQVLRNTVQKELLMSDHPMVAVLTADNLSELKAFIAAPDTWEDGLGFSPGSAPSVAAAEYLFALFQSGARSIEVKQPILRVTRVTNPNYDAPFDVSNTDKILSTARMISDSGVPSNFAVPLLDLANALMARIPVDGDGFADRTDALALKFGWLKDVNTAETLGTSRNQYVIEYKFGLWDVELFGAVVA